MKPIKYEMIFQMDNLSAKLCHVMLLKSFG